MGYGSHGQNGWLAVLHAAPGARRDRDSVWVQLMEGFHVREKGMKQEAALSRNVQVRKYPAMINRSVGWCK